MVHQSTETSLIPLKEIILILHTGRSLCQSADTLPLRHITESHLQLHLTETGLHHHQSLIAHLLITMKALQASMGHRLTMEMDLMMDAPQRSTVIARMIDQTLIDFQNLTDCLQSTMAIELMTDLRILTGLLSITVVYITGQISMKLPITRAISRDHQDMKRVP